MRPRASGMLTVKVKMEKSDLEASAARNRLDSVLQGLVDKSDVEREQTEEDSSKPPATDPHPKDSSPPSASKRSSTRFPHQRRKKRKEMEDNSCEGALQRPNAYTMKLFDRSVDLAQFGETTPLYPICRAWMRNNPGARHGPPSPGPPSPTPSPAPAPPSHDQEAAEQNGQKSQDVYHLPLPTPRPIAHRVPSPLPCTDKPLDISLTRSAVPAVPTLLYHHMERWKKIRLRWKESSHRNQHRYTDSMKILKDMFDRQ